MKILMMNYEYPPLGGGAGRATCQILKELSMMKDVEVDLITSSTGDYRVETVNDRVRIFFLDVGKKGILQYQKQKDLLGYAMKSFSFARRLKKEVKYDLCHAFFGIPSGFIAKCLSIPYIVSLRGSDVPYYSSRFYWQDKLLFRRLSKHTWRKAIRVVANSMGLRTLARKTNHKQIIGVIPNGVDTTYFKRDHFPRKEGKIRLKVVSTGRLIKRKGYEKLILAVAGRDDIQVTIVGDGKKRKELEEFTEECSANVVFAGYHPHDKLKGFLENADVFVMPSYNEGMSNSVLEAMAMGLPIIATDVGGTKELVHGNGFIVKPGSSTGIARALGEYMGDSDLIKEHGKVSRKIAEKMSWGVVAREYYALYRLACKT
jgi:glycosyltransferase involved in cell wall biosynthesis